MRRRIRDLVLTVLLAGATACGRGSQGSGPAAAPEAAAATTTTTATPSPTSATTTTASTTPSPTPTPTPTASTTASTTPAATILRSAVAVEPGSRLPIVPGAEVVVHPSSTFEVELSVRAPDARLALVDARDDHVAAAGTRELSPSRTRLTLTPSAALVPGSRYALRLDGAADRELHDDAGRAFAPVSLPLLAAGSPPPPEPKRPERKRRRR